MTLKRNGLIAISVLLIVVILFSIFFINKNGKYTPVSSLCKLSSRQIIIDPGHGGEDGGAVVGKITEKDINLDISLMLEKVLQEQGFDVILTRTEDVSIYDGGDKQSLRSKKKSDLMNRLKIANENSGAVMISIHQNKFAQSKYYGAQMFYGLKSDMSKPLAESIQKSFVKILQPENTREIKPIGSDVYLTNNSKIPSVLCECGFLSNPDEITKLNDPTYQKQVAFTITQGILNFYASNT